MKQPSLGGRDYYDGFVDALIEVLDEIDEGTSDKWDIYTHCQNRLAEVDVILTTIGDK